MAGNVEFVDVYDHRYFNVYVNGVSYGSTHKHSWTDWAFKNSIRKEWAKMAGVTVDELRYTCYDLYSKLVYDDDYDANDFDEYVVVMKAITDNKIKPDFKNKDLDWLEENY